MTYGYSYPYHFAVRCRDWSYGVVEIQASQPRKNHPEKQRLYGICGNFTLKSVPFPEMAQIIKTANFKQNAGADVSGTVGNMRLQAGSYYTATLTCTEHTEEKMTYRFEFVSWHSSHGMPKYADEMNVLMTAVEKIFLGIDPDTQVSQVKNDIKTKRSLL